MNDINQKRRDSNLELFRILTMLLIIAHHYVVNSGLTDSDGPIFKNLSSSRSIFLLLVGAWGKIGINAFVMITGYFMCKSNITARKFVKLLFEWLFYRYIIYLIFLISGYEKFSIRSFLLGVVPIYQIDKNFTGCFIIFWLCIPFLNILIHNLTEKKHFYLLLLLTFTYVFFGTTHTISMNYVSWFSILYIIASYIRIYPKEWMKNNIIIGVVLLVSIILSVISVILCAKINFSVYWFVSDCNTLFAVIVGIFSFLFFLNLKIPHNTFINIMGASTFGVLCIHACSNTMRRWLWKDVLNVVGHYDSPFLYIHVFLSIICVFVGCFLIDFLRIKLIEDPFLLWWDNHFISIKTKISEIEKSVLDKLNINN